MLRLLPCLLPLAAIATVQAALFPSKTPVVQLSQSNFNKEVLAIEKPTMVMFSAPWCGHCKNLAPHYHKAASTLDGIVKFANIDCDADANKGLCAQYQIQGFPTLKFFPATKKRLPRDYRGERTAKALVEYAKETLPQGARRIDPAELEKYVTENPTRPKVILFSNKPKSSPLYRSLALDFRKTLDFGFMRGDESLVRSSARLTLGLDIPTEKDLPVLIIIPGRPEVSGEEPSPIEKGSFETYAGPLKYWKIKAWLDEVATKVGADKSKAPNPPAKRKPFKKPKKNYSDEVIPEGGTVEWKAHMPSKEDQHRNMVHEAIDRYEEAQAAAAEAPDAPIMDESKPQRDSFEGQKIDIEVAGKIADEVRAKTEKENKKRTGKGKQYYKEKDGSVTSRDGDDDTNATKEAGGLLNKAKAAVGAAIDTAAQAVKDASDSITEQTAQAGEKVYDTASQAYNDASVAVGGGMKTAQKVFASDGKPFEKKSQALMKQFEKWMSGEKEGWEEELGEQFEKAQAEAEELLEKDPEEARRQAWESEEWLLKEMKGDRERMMSVMTDEQKAQVEGMIELIEGRLKEKGSKDVFEKVLDPTTGDKLEKEVKEEHQKKHDEL